MRKTAMLLVLVLLASSCVTFGDAGKGRASGRAEPRTVLFELFTAVNDTDCANSERALSRLASNYSRDSLAILEWFPNDDPLDTPTYLSPEYIDRYVYYTILSTPSDAVDGEVHRNTGNQSEDDAYQSYKSIIDAHLGVTPVATLIGNLTLNQTHGTLRYLLNFTSRVTEANLVIYSFLYEDNVQYLGTSNVSVHRFVARRQLSKMSLGAYPVYFPGNTAEGSASFELDPAWNRANLGAVVVLQSDATRLVLQSKVMSPNVAVTRAVDLEPAEQTVEISAGKTGEAAVTVKNAGTGTDTVDLALSGNAAAWATLGQSSAELAPGQQASARVSIYVPLGTAAGTYGLIVKGTSRSDGTKFDEAKVFVLVKEELAYGVLLSPSRAEQEVKTGDTATFQVRVKNTGTLEDSFDLAKMGAQSSWASLSREALTLPPNGEDAVTLTVEVPSDISTGRYDITVRGTSRADPTKYGDSLAVLRVNETSNEAYGVDIQPRQLTRLVSPGGSALITLTVTNTGTGRDTVDLSKSGDASSWAQFEPMSLDILASAQGEVDVAISVPAGTLPDKYTLVIRATSRGDTTQRSETTLTLDVQPPDEPPKITAVNHTPSDPTNKDLVTITATVTGTNIVKVELVWSEDGVSGPVQTMQKSGTTWSHTFGPVKKSGTLVKYHVTAFSGSGKSARSADQSFTVKSAPAPAKKAPGFELPLLLLAAAAAALLALRREGPARDRLAGGLRDPRRGPRVSPGPGRRRCT